MTTAHLIYGYIGSGKTTFARRLERRLPAVRFSSDEWISRLYADDEAQITDFGVLLGRVESVMQQVWCRCLDLGIDVVLDQGFWARAKRDGVREMAAELGADTRLYHVYCADSVAWQRVEHRNADPRDSIRMSRETFDNLRDRLEPLGPDEPHHEVRT